MFPNPTEYPMIDRKNCILPDHAALSGSSSPAALPLDTIEPLGPCRTIVTPGLAAPSRAPRFEFSGAISCPFFVTSGLLVAIVACRPRSLEPLGIEPAAQSFTCAGYASAVPLDSERHRPSTIDTDGAVVRRTGRRAHRDAAGRDRGARNCPTSQAQGEERERLRHGAAGRRALLGAGRKTDPMAGTRGCRHAKSVDQGRRVVPSGDTCRVPTRRRQITLRRRRRDSHFNCRRDLFLPHKRDKKSKCYP